MTFHYSSGPFVDTVAGIVAGPWSAESAIDGTSRLLCGMDTIAFRDERITEYWTVAKEVDTIGAWTNAFTIP